MNCCEDNLLCGILNTSQCISLEQLKCLRFQHDTWLQSPCEMTSWTSLHEARQNHFEKENCYVLSWSILLSIQCNMLYDMVSFCLFCLRMRVLQSKEKKCKLFHEKMGYQPQRTLLCLLQIQIHHHNNHRLPWLKSIHHAMFPQEQIQQ